MQSQKLISDFPQAIQVMVVDYGIYRTYREVSHWIMLLYNLIYIRSYGT